MPDKKVSQQTEHITPVLGADLLPLVGNTATTPTNYKVQIKNFFSQVQIDLPQTTFSALKITAAVTANALVATLAAAEFGMVANSSVGVTGLNRYGMLASNKIQNGNTTITGQCAVALFTLDTGNSVTVASNTYGVMISHALDTGVTAARKTAPRAFLAIMDDAGTNVAALTSYLFDIGAQGKTVNANTSANASAIFCPKGASALSHVLKICVNGTDMWLLASNVAPA